MRVFKNDFFLQRAYDLWATSNPEMPYELCERKVTVQIVKSLRQENFLVRCLTVLLVTLNPQWIQKKIRTALSAYKFDLICSDRAMNHLNLFNTNEKWFFDHKLTVIFKNILVKTKATCLWHRAHRFDLKIQKYHSKKELLIGSYLLFLIGKVFTEFRKMINWMKAMNVTYLEEVSKNTLLCIEDEGVLNGITSYLTVPFNPEKPLTRICVELSCHVAKEKAKICIRDVGNYVYPLITRLGLSRATRVAKPASSVA